MLNTVHLLFREHNSKFNVEANNNRQRVGGEGWYTEHSNLFSFELWHLSEHLLCFLLSSSEHFADRITFYDFSLCRYGGKIWMLFVERTYTLRMFSAFVVRLQSNTQTLMTSVSMLVHIMAAAQGSTLYHLHTATWASHEKTLCRSNPAEALRPTTFHNKHISRTTSTGLTLMWQWKTNCLCKS